MDIIFGISVVLYIFPSNAVLGHSLRNPIHLNPVLLAETHDERECGVERHVLTFARYSTLS